MSKTRKKGYAKVTSTPTKILIEPKFLKIFSSFFMSFSFIVCVKPDDLNGQLTVSA